MLKGINPLLSGELLLHLDRLGHSDAVVVADAHFPAHRLGPPALDIAAGTPAVLAAITEVLELDDRDALTLMHAGDTLLPVQRELCSAAGFTDAHLAAVQGGDTQGAPAHGVTAQKNSAREETTHTGSPLIALADRHRFYELAAAAQLIVRCAETRIYANALIRKGVTPAAPSSTPHSPRPL